MDKYQAVQTFLNENLEKHFKSIPNSIIGTKTSYDSMGGRYATYAFHHCDRPNLATENKMEGWYVLLKEITAAVDKIIDGLMLAKLTEKPEGGSIAQRATVIDWRQFPQAYVDDDFIRSPKMAVSFRLSVHHK
jgi:hypothetical protein